MRRLLLGLALLGLAPTLLPASAAADPSPPVRFLSDDEADDADRAAPTDPDRPRLAPVCEPPSGAPPGRDRVRALWAGADAPRMALAVDHAGVLIGHMALMLPVWGDAHTPGLFVALWPQIELEGSPIPYRSWRGRIAVEVGRAFRRPSGQRFSVELSGGLRHESDHVTDVGAYRSFFAPRPTTAVVLNDIFGRLTLRGPLSHWDVVTSITPRAHVLTCTAEVLDCVSGAEGDVTLGGDLDVVAVSLRPWFWELGPFVSVRADGHVEHARALSEWRVALRAGLVDLYGPRGAWQLALGLRTGHPVGLDRGGDALEHRALFSLAWSR